MKKSSQSSRYSGKSVTHTDLYQEVTNQIIEALEQGSVPWRKPWTDCGEEILPLGFPCNAFSERSYSGVNVLLLWMAQSKQGYQTPRWLTFRQALEAGGNVRKGEQATTIVWYRSVDVPATDEQNQPVFDEEGNPQMKSRYYLKAHHVFNVDQCDGLPDSLLGSDLPVITTEESLKLDSETLDRVQTMVQQSGVHLTHRKQMQAYYQPKSDSIVLPQVRQFDSEADYWSTTLHELVHSTGHVKRLNREGIASSNHNVQKYAFEELVAEIGSAFMCSQLKVFGELQHASYVDSWLQQLREDKRAIFRASKQAREASEYLMALEQLALAA